MQHYETFDLWAAAQTNRHQKLIRTLRRLVNKTAPRLAEIVKWGNGCFTGEKWPVIYIYADSDHLQFGFFAGAKLKDPEQRLLGAGQHVRHVKVFTPKDVDAVYLSKLIRQAVKLGRAA